MKCSTKYVALDVHQATTVASVREETGRVLLRTVLPTDATALVAFFRGIRGTIEVTFEEGTQAQWLHDLLVPVVDRVLVCDRRGTSAQGHKSDQRDADALSNDLRRGTLRAVYHASPECATLKDLARAYATLVTDTTRVMARLKAIYRARGITTTGRGVYDPATRGEWLGKLGERGAQFRARMLYAELETLQALRPHAKTALVTEAKRDPAWRALRTIPFLGPVRVAMLFATLQTPWRFRTKRQLWAYAGLAVVTRTSAEYTLHEGRPVRRARAPMTRGLNRNYNRVVKDVLKGAATAAAARPGPLKDWYQHLLTRGIRAELARVTLTRKLAALTLHVWKTGADYDPAKLTTSAVPVR
jgi:transposase